MRRNSRPARFLRCLTGDYASNPFFINALRVLKKNYRMALTGRQCQVRYLSRWKRGSFNQGVRSTYIWDCKLDSILSPPPPRLRRASRLAKEENWGAKLSFFVNQNVRRAGSLTSTYRVVSTTLRAESENNVAQASCLWSAESFSYHNLGPAPCVELDHQIDQATKSASWMPWCQ
jgi:hypothetical protein